MKGKITEASKQPNDEQVVQILIKELLKSKATAKFVITGFPRTLAQATMFESMYGEIQSLIEVICPVDVLMERALTKGRNEEFMKQGIEDYNQKTKQVGDYYSQLGKLKEVDGTLNMSDTYKQFVKASIPQLYFIIGPKCAGKSSVCKYLADRANMSLFDFKNFANIQAPTIKNSPELLTTEFIKEIHKINASRLLIEGFPETSKQLMFFLSNAVQPEGVMILHATESSCLHYSKSSGTTPAVVCKQVKEFYANLKEIQGILSKLKCVHELKMPDDKPVEQLFDKVGQIFSPEVILVRSDNDAQESMIGAINEMSEKLGYRQLNIPLLRREEISRKTAVGKKMIEFTAKGKIIPAELTIEFLRKMIYSADGYNKFILLGFPEEIEQLDLLEKTCVHISKEFYFYPKEGEKVQNSGIQTIETYMHKMNKLIPLNSFESESLERYYGTHLQYAFIMGAALSGKTYVAKRLEKYGFTLLDSAILTEDVKKKLATPDNPPESINVTPDQLLNELKNRTVNRVDKKEKFVLDGWALEPELFNKIVKIMGTPEFYIDLLCEPAVLKERFKKKNEIQEMSEEQNAEFEKNMTTFKSISQTFENFKTAPYTQVIQINTSGLIDYAYEQLKAYFEPRLLLVRHDHSIAVDAILTNLSIKYDILYIAVPNLIKDEIKNETSLGITLLNTRKLREMTEEFKADPDWIYSPIHYDFKLVIKLVKDAIKKLRTTQMYILLNGFLNAHKLKDETDKIELRPMDELFALDKEIGEITSILRLTRGDYEKVEDDRIAIKPEVVVPVVKAPTEKKEGEEEKKEEVPPASEDPNGEKKVMFKPEDFAWTNTEGKPRSLGQHFTNWKKCANKNMMSNEIQPEGGNTEIVLDSLISAVTLGELAKNPIYIQVKFSA